MPDAPHAHRSRLRAVMGLAAESAQAIMPAPKNGSRASSDGFDMEGIKKQVGACAGRALVQGPSN